MYISLSSPSSMPLHHHVFSSHYVDSLVQRAPCTLHNSSWRSVQKVTTEIGITSKMTGWFPFVNKTWFENTSFRNMDQNDKNAGKWTFHIYTKKNRNGFMWISRKTAATPQMTEFCQYADTHKKTDVCTHQAVMVQRSNWAVTNENKDLALLKNS